MNKNFLEHYMKTKPDTNEQKYLFLVDNIDLAFALISAGYPAITLIEQQGYRRLLVLDINRTIPEEEKDSQLKEKMCKESDYAIHMAVLALKQLYTDNHFTESDHSKECIANLYRSADSVKAFTDDMPCFFCSMLHFYLLVH